MQRACVNARYRRRRDRCAEVAPGSVAWVRELCFTEEMSSMSFWEVEQGRVDRVCAVIV